MADNRRYYMDYTGTGNTLNMRHPHVLQLIMDSLRYWVLEMHVDGFRFDLAATLARELHDVDRLSAFFDLIQQDPVVSQVKLIAEPWDVGEGGYQVGNFPPLWSEWNGKYRDTRARLLARHRSDARASSPTGSPAARISTRAPARRPYASINFITAHDGFTLRDLVSYNEKHNEANGEDNRDGESHNRSWNCGVEGPTDDPGRARAARAGSSATSSTTLLLSQGVPMLLGGDEIGRTQRGNNNAYCQDNEISWYDWEHADEELLQFTRRLIRLRHRHPVFCRRRWFQGRPIHGTEVSDIGWFTPGGDEMTEEDWQAGFAKSLGVFLNGRAHSDAERARRAGRRRQLLRDVQRAPRAGRVHAAGGEVGTDDGRNCSRPTSGQKTRTWTRRVLSIGGRRSDGARLVADAASPHRLRTDVAAADSDTLEKPGLRHPEVLRRRARQAARGAARYRARDRARHDRRPGPPPAAARSSSAPARRHARRAGRRASRGRRRSCRSTASCPPICPSAITQLAGRSGAPRRLIVAPRGVLSAGGLRARGAGRFSSMPRARGAAGASAISPICAGWAAGRASRAQASR